MSVLDFAPRLTRAAAFCLLLALLTLGLARAASATTIYYVSTTGSGLNNGLSWQTAKSDLQATLHTAVSGDQVWVKRGTYTGNFTATDGVTLYGGFAGTETNITQRNIAANPTILDGSSNGTVYTIPSTATGTNGVDGFTLQNGTFGGLSDSSRSDTLDIANCTFFNNTTGDSGGGIYTDNVDTTISGCMFTNNNGGAGGGGIEAYEFTTTLTIANCTFTGNIGTYGGAVSTAAYTTIINGSVFTNNSTGSGGGAVNASDATISDCTFTGNTATNNSQGGGIITSGTSTIVNCTFGGSSTSNANTPQAIYLRSVGNTSTSPPTPAVVKDCLFIGSGTTSTDPDGIDVDSGGGTSYVIFANNTFVDLNADINVASSSGTLSLANNIFTNSAGGLNDTGSPTFTSSHNDFYGNTTYNYSGVNLDATDLIDNPMFVNAANGGYQLESNSPLINAGDDHYVTSGDKDLAGHPRIYGSHVDIGCYEYGSAPAPTVTSFTPTSGPVGTVVTVTGANLNGVTAVRFHNANATVFSANASGTTLTVTVPTGAGTGTFTVTTSGGSVKTTGTFTVIPAPTVTSFTPTSGPVGTVVTITGTNLGGVTRVRFHNASATTYSVNGAGTQITVTVPSGAGTGTITVNTPGGSVTSTQTFTVTTPAVPTVHSLGFNPSTIAPGGTSTGTITLSGSAPTGGSVVAVYLDSITFETVTVAAGTATATFGVMAAPTAPAGSHSFAASYNGTSASATLTVN